MKVARIFGFFLAICAGVAVLCAVGGALFAHFRGGTTYQHAIGWAMWIGGALLALLVAQSGSTTRMAGESRIVVGGRFARGAATFLSPRVRGSSSPRACWSSRWECLSTTSDSHAPGQPKLLGKNSCVAVH